MTHREWLGRMVRVHGFTTGVELGVKAGETLDYLLSRFPDLTMIGVDVWQPIEGDVHEHWPHGEHACRAMHVMAKHEGRCSLMPMSTTEAASMVEGPVDFVFVDADHRYEAAKQDIQDWRPKCKFLCGHDAGQSGVRKALDELLPGWVRGPAGCWHA